MNESDPKKLKKHQMTKLLLKQNIEPERRTPKGKTRQIPAHLKSLKQVVQTYEGNIIQD